MMTFSSKPLAHVVLGSAQKGKTSTIRGVAQHMLSTSGNLKYFSGMFPISIPIPTTGDFSCIIEHTNNNGVKLVYAIMSAGDNNTILNQYWKTLNNYSGNVDIVIGACRTRGATTNWWHNPLPNPPPNPQFKIKWFYSNDDHGIHHQLYTNLKVDIFKLVLNI